MVSDIKGLNARQTPAPRSGEAGPVRSDTRTAGSERAGGGAASDDTVELSGLAEVIRTAARALASEPPVDETRVRELKESVANGDYQVDPERLARKLIDADNS
jgi:negative regulator of flagellin synthesis FlgM